MPHACVHHHQAIKGVIRRAQRRSVNQKLRQSSLASAFSQMRQPHRGMTGTPIRLGIAGSQRIKYVEN